MPKELSPLATWSQYLGARVASTLLSSFDVDANLRTGRAIGRVMHRFDKKHRERAAVSIRRCFPEYTEDRVQALVRASFEHFIQFAIETLHTPRLMTEGGWSRYVKFGDVGPVMRVLNQREPVLMLTGHIGNWEILGYTLATLGYPLNALARPLDNKLLNDWVMGIREERGMRIITKWGAADEMLELIQRKEPIAFVADQNAGHRGLFVPFFGRLASTYKSIGLLAMRYEIPVLVGCAHRIGNTFRYEAMVQDAIYPQDWADQPDPLFYISARFNKALEDAIRKHPEQYLWMHRRWKSRPKHELAGKPMPKALRRKLESLPWMTDELMTGVNTPLLPEHQKT